MTEPCTEQPVSKRGVVVDDAGLTVEGDCRSAPLSVLFDGRRVWSLRPRRDGVVDAGRGTILVTWPSLLLPYLDGTAHVVVRRLDSGADVFAGEVRFGSGEGRVSVIGELGKPLAIDKGMHLTPTFDRGRDDLAKQALLDGVEKVLEGLHGEGVPAFLAFGCLLGAVRDQHLIGHDNDADVVYLARATHPLDVIVESMRLERRLASLGHVTRRLSGADFKVLVRVPDGTRLGIDVFTAFYRGDVLYVMPTVRAELSVSKLLPYSVVRLEGRSFEAPHDAEALLEATYGPTWRVPDPSFRFDTPRATRRLLTGLMRGDRRHERYWGEFYTVRRDRVPHAPSAFARWVAEREVTPGPLLDLGSGTGRDTLWFSEQGFESTGYDYSREGLEYAAQLAAAQALDLRFRRLNLYDLRHVLALGAEVAQDVGPSVVYARFLVDALEDEGRINLWRISRAALRATLGRLYLEFRTEDEFGEHFRRFVQPEQVMGELESYGFTIEHCENQHGLAVHKHEDPRVCRIVAKMEA
ncbi:MAG: class I SAM-dependent methyltransferase [Nocardioidaceae bacterium]